MFHNLIHLALRDKGANILDLHCKCASVSTPSKLLGLDLGNCAKFYHHPRINGHKRVGHFAMSLQLKIIFSKLAYLNRRK